MNSTIYALIIIAVMAALTYGARLFPYLLFGRGGKVPPIITYLGNVLPPAVMILLIVYCLRNVVFTVYPHGIPEFLAIAVAAILYKITKNNLLAIVSGTVLYMVFIQLIFV
ncbi:MAG: AzlD domain-containing protein [Clostridiales Family XIII bacterium]|jgi:branched-subunit amino acid transport protein AzlD|nr:AzlD domain-containing protein [Clostridiales Family XIII bacterium]